MNELFKWKLELNVEKNNDFKIEVMKYSAVYIEATEII